MHTDDAHTFQRKKEVLEKMLHWHPSTKESRKEALYDAEPEL